MGGREKKRHNRLSDRETWITEVSTPRLQKYLKMLKSSGARHRLDGRVRERMHFDDVGDVYGYSFRFIVEEELRLRNESQ